MGIAVLCVTVLLISCGPLPANPASNVPAPVGTPPLLSTPPGQPPGQAVIDFLNCVPQRKRIDTAFGSTTFEIVGIQGDKCTMRYGSETENPNTVAALNTTCQVPRALGTQFYRTTSAGIDFSALAPYCVKSALATVAPTQESPMGEIVAIDFGSCVPQRKRIDFAFGSTTYEIVGVQGDQCTIRYGTEIENPNAVGNLDTVCQVPRALGVLIFAATDNGVDFSPLAPYCAKIK